MQARREMSGFEPAAQGFRINAELQATVGKRDKGHGKISFRSTSTKEGTSKGRENGEAPGIEDIPWEILGKAAGLPEDFPGNVGSPLAGLQTAAEMVKAGETLMPASPRRPLQDQWGAGGCREDGRASSRCTSGTESGQSKPVTRSAS